MVHPNNVAGIERMKNYYLNNLIGNPLDTTIAAACLVFGTQFPTHIAPTAVLLVGLLKLAFD